MIHSVWTIKISKTHHKVKKNTVNYKKAWIVNFVVTESLKISSLCIENELLFHIYIFFFRIASRLGTGASSGLRIRKQKWVMQYIFHYVFAYRMCSLQVRTCGPITNLLSCVGFLLTLCICFPSISFHSRVDNVTQEGAAGMEFNCSNTWFLRIRVAIVAIITRVRATIKRLLRLRGLHRKWKKKKKCVCVWN